MNRTAWAATGFLFFSIAVAGIATGCSGAATDGSGANAVSTDGGGDSSDPTKCPSVVTDVDVPCKTDPSLTCYSTDSRLYPDGPECDPKAVQCVDGKWQELPQTESNPTVVCPATLPADGDACPALDCSSENKTCNFGCQYAECDALDPHWRVHTYTSAECQAVDGGSADAGDGG